MARARLLGADAPLDTPLRKSGPDGAALQCRRRAKARVGAGALQTAAEQWPDGWAGAAASRAAEVDGVRGDAAPLRRATCRGLELDASPRRESATLQGRPGSATPGCGRSRAPLEPLRVVAATLWVPPASSIASGASDVAEGRNVDASAAGLRAVHLCVRTSRRGRLCQATRARRSMALDAALSLW